MATREEYEQVMAFSRIDGAFVGALWIISFAFFVGEFYAPVLGIVSLAVGLSSVILAVVRISRFRDNVLDGCISFRRAFGYGAMTYFNASILMALAQYIYFQFIDGGFVMSRYMAMASTPAFKAMAEQSGMTASDIRLAMDNLASLRPIDIAFQFLSLNVIMGLVISILTALIVKSDFKKKQ